MFTKIFYLELIMVKYNENAIREAAYYIWQNSGCPSGQDEQIWAMAIEQLSNNCKSSSCKTSAKKTSTSSKKATASSTKSKTSSSKKNSK